MTTKKTLKDFGNVLALTLDTLESSLAWTDETFPLHAHLQPGHEKVLFVAGPNATGKSYFVEFLRAWNKVHQKNATSISISIRERVGGGLHEMAGMRKAMIFGDETEQSTGATSAMVIERAFKNLPSRAEEGYRTLLVLDEPELGLSEGYTRAMGQFLAQSAKDMPEKTIGLVVVSHSKALARALEAGLGTAPSFVHTGAARSFEEWASDTDSKSVEELLELANTGHRIRKEIWAYESKVTAAK